MSWQPISTAPKDGTRILGWDDEYGVRETCMQKYQPGSPGYAEWKQGNGPIDYGWCWYEPQSGWISTWKPTYWMALPAAPVGSTA